MFVWRLVILKLNYYVPLCTFYIGIGSALNLDGNVEMDAMIMDGTNLNAGSVAGVCSVQNPISLARAVMEQVNTQPISLTMVVM